MMDVTQRSLEGWSPQTRVHSTCSHGVFSRKRKTSRLLFSLPAPSGHGGTVERLERGGVEATVQPQAPYLLSEAKHSKHIPGQVPSLPCQPSSCFFCPSTKQPG